MERKKDAGYAVFIAVILSLILSIVAVTFLVMGYNYYHSADQHYLDAKGFYAAEAGRVLAAARAWRGNYTYITNHAVGDSSVSVNFQDAGSGKYVLRITSKVP